MSFFSFSKKEEKKMAIVYDVGSSSVGCALVVYSEKKVPKIIYSVRKEIVYQETFNIRRFHSLVVKAIKEASEDVQKNGFLHLKFTKLGEMKPHKVFVTMSSPWYASQTRIIKLVEDKPFLVTEKKINKWIQKEVQSFKNSDYVKKYSGNDVVKIIEEQVISIKLNGYETSNPYRKKASTFEASIVLSVSPEDIIKKIDDTIFNTFNEVQIEFNSFPLVAFSVIRDSNKSIEDFIFMDISGEITDLMISKKCVPFEVTTFPMGKNNILRKLSKEFNTNKEETASLLSMYTDNKLNGSEVIRVGNAINSVRSEWVMSLQKALEDMSENFSIPSSVFFTSDKQLSNWFEESIKSEQFSQFTMSNKPFSVFQISDNFLNRNVKLGNYAKADSFLVINSVFFNKLV
jgi:cell division ATPase FtsA